MDIDIGLVVLNAGIAVEGRLMYADASKLESMLNLNCYHVMSLMHLFTQRLK